MQHNKMIELRCEVEGKKFTLLCDEGASTYMAKFALCEFIKYVGQIDDNEKARLEAEAAMKKESIVEFNPEAEPKAE